MLTNLTKGIALKVSYWAIRIIPVVIPVLLIMHANCSASTINGQPTPPASLKKYRKF